MPRGMRARHLLIAVLLPALAACTRTATPALATPIPATASPSILPPPDSPVPTSEPAPIDPQDSLVDPPPRPFDYTVVNPQPPRRVPNATRAFWVTDGTTGERREITARLRVQTDRVAMWVEEDVWHDVRLLEQAAIFFETELYPATRAVFGSEWTPGVDNDPHIHVLHATGLGEGVLGYASSADEFPVALCPFSNEAELITVNLDAVEVGSAPYYALLVHQFQRLAHWFQDRNEALWVEEGLAELAVRLSGFAPGTLEQAYLQQPDTSLVNWQDGDETLHRSAAYLFAIYFYERFGSEGIQALMSQPLNGAAGFDAVLAEMETGLAFEDLFASWLMDNYLDGSPGYGYTALALDHPTLAAVCESYPITIETSVQQFGADYILFHGESDLHIRFAGAAAAPLLDVQPHSGYYSWWSNRGDESMTTLARTLDLSRVDQATLSYWVWYDLEPDYDYATVEVSTDGGQQWRILPTPSGTDADPHGNNPGWGYTGSSGGWIHEEADLTPYAGTQVQVRFVVLTDGAITGAGLLLDDVAISEIGFADDMEAGPGEWQAAGFMRSSNRIPQRYLALLIGLGSSITVERLPFGEGQTGEWTIPLNSAMWDEAVLVLSGLAAPTDHPAPYRLTIEE